MSRNNGLNNQLLEELTYSLHKFGMRSVLFQQHMAQKIGVAQTDLKTAEVLKEKGPITAGELAAITGLSTGSVTALIDRLEKSGYVSREKDPADRRKVRIVPIIERQEEIQSHYQALGNTAKRVCSSYSEEELTFVLRFMEKMTAIIEEENRKLMDERKAQQS